MQTNMTQIENYDDLEAKLIKAQNEENRLELAILLGEGIAKSSKSLFKHKNGMIWITHEIDDTEEVFSNLTKLLKSTNLGTALKMGALYAY